MNEVRVVKLEPGRDRSLLKSPAIMILSKFSPEIIPSNSPQQMQCGMQHWSNRWGNIHRQKEQQRESYHARELCKVSETVHKCWDEVKILRITGESDSQ